MSPVSRISLGCLLVFLLSATGSFLYGQDTVIKGIVRDTSGIGLANVTVFSPADGKGTVTDTDGHFIFAPGNSRSSGILIISSIGYISDTVTYNPADSGRFHVIILQNEIIKISDVSIVARKTGQTGSILIPVAASMIIPSVSAGIEAVVQTMPGVSTFSELTYQYSVRGGSYDENLVYINDIEIIRPYLIRAGQQEGLSQINPDLVASVSFSPGGFSATYGDRLSSVLDIRYRKPEKNEASLSLSLLTSSAHAGFISTDKKFYVLSGIRYRSNTLLLRSLDAAGNYNPFFSDIQAIAGYKTGPSSELKFSLWSSFNRYSFTPESQTTTFGSVFSAYKLFALFEGGEKDHYDNLCSALTYDISHNRNLSSRFILSGNISSENENHDIRGAYSLNSLDKTQGSENNPDSLLNIGVGSWIDHARNRLLSKGTTISYKGSYTSANSLTEWGISARYRGFETKINEWVRVDSAGFTLGTLPEQLTLTSFEHNEDFFSSIGAESYINNATGFTFAERNWDINTGLRISYDTYNRQVLFSPRASIKVYISPDFSAHIAVGAYHQPPGGRELMRHIGGIEYPLKAQRSYHLTTGTSLSFFSGERPFRFTAEIYAKKMDQLIPYKVDNVRLLYYGGNVAEGYSAGLDLRINGEFVKGTESWFSLSFMKSELRIPSLNTGWFPAPFDQRVNLDIFFQDYLPGNPDFRAHINIIFGTGVPASPPGRDPWDIWFRMPPYRRIDIGFSKVIIGGVRRNNTGRPGSSVKEMIAGLEIFNLADIRNTISYTWIRSVRNSEGVSIEYAVPNYLTRRSLNFRITARF